MCARACILVSAPERLTQFAPSAPPAREPLVAFLFPYLFLIKLNRRQAPRAGQPPAQQMDPETAVETSFRRPLQAGVMTTESWNKTASQPNQPPDVPGKDAARFPWREDSRTSGAEGRIIPYQTMGHQNRRLFLVVLRSSARPACSEIEAPVAWPSSCRFACLTCAATLRNIDWSLQRPIANSIWNRFQLGKPGAPVKKLTSQDQACASLGVLSCLSGCQSCQCVSRPRILHKGI